MNSATHVDLDWVGMESAQVGAGVSPAVLTNDTAGAAYLTDEDILGLEPIGSDAPATTSVIPSAVRDLSGGLADGTENPQRDSSGTNRPRNDKSAAVADAMVPADGSAAVTANARATTASMPAWMAAAAADPRHAGEAQQLWREHQEFRAAFASPEEARAVKQLLPGGMRDVLSLREATQSVERIDAALFSGDVRAQAEVVAEIARANPAAFRSLFAEAAKVLAGQGGNGTQTSFVVPSTERNLSDAVAERMENPQRDSSGQNRPRNDSAAERVENLSPGPKDSSFEPPASSLQHFDPGAYAAFERQTNDAVARDVRGSIGDTLARVMPDGVAEGAARRIGEDIFYEVHRAMAADRSLSEQVAGVLHERRFGGAEQQRVASLLTGRARQLVPSVARRVIGEWTSSVLNTARSKAARQATAASRVDIAAAGGSLDSMPLRQMSSREVNYTSMSDEEILGM